MRRQINSDELAYLFNQIGKSVWHLQHVENALVPYIVIKGIAKELNSLEESVARKHERDLNKLPLGTLIGKAVEMGILQDPLLTRLRTFNNERKWIVHNSIFESGDLLYTDQGRSAVFTRINKFIAEAIFLHKHIGELIVEYSVSRGMDRKTIDAIAQNQIRKLKGEA